MDYVLDTNVLIEIERGNPDIIAELKRQFTDEDVFFIAAPSYAEFYYGVLERYGKAAEDCLKNLDGHDILNTSKNSSRLFAELKYGLKKKGALIPSIDLFIASITLDAGMALITTDNHYTRIADLKVVLLR